MWGWGMVTVMNSDEFNCATCAKVCCGAKGFSGESLGEFQGPLRRAEGSGSMLEAEGILLSLRVNEDKTSVYRDYLAGYL